MLTGSESPNVSMSFSFTSSSSEEKHSSGEDWVPASVQSEDSDEVDAEETRRQYVQTWAKNVGRQAHKKIERKGII